MDPTSKLAKQFDVKGYPTFYLIDKNGEVIHKSAGYGDGTEEDDELSIHFNSANRLQICGGGDSSCATTAETFSTGVWYHIAVTHDYTNTFVSDVDIYINNKRVVEDNSFTDFDAYPSSSDLIIGKGDEDDSTAFFSGVIDEVRILNYQSMAFGGGLMISKVAGNFVGEGTITIFNAAGSTVDLTGVRLMKNSVSDLQCAALSGTLKLSSNFEQSNKEPMQMRKNIGKSKT